MVLGMVFILTLGLSERASASPACGMAKPGTGARSVMDDFAKRMATADGGVPVNNVGSLKLKTGDRVVLKDVSGKEIPGKVEVYPSAGGKDPIVKFRSDRGDVVPLDSTSAPRYRSVARAPEK